MRQFGEKIREERLRWFMDAVREDMAEVDGERHRRKDQMEMENLLWRPLTGKAERRRRRNKTDVSVPTFTAAKEKVLGSVHRQYGLRVAQR